MLIRAKALKKPSADPEATESNRKRKRSQEVEDSASPAPQKRVQSHLASPPAENEARQEAADHASKNELNPIIHWIQEGSWPQEYFEQGNQTWDDLKADKKAEELRQVQKELDKRQAAKVNMAHPFLTQKKSSACLRRQALEAGGIIPSQDTEDKSASYEDPSYTILLAGKGSFLNESDQGATEECKALCQVLLDTAQPTPKDSLFRDDLFQETCQKLQDRNEARVINDIARLIVPSAETLTTCGETHLKDLVVQINERWNECIPVTAKLPHPDYSVGFSRSAFTDDQLNKLYAFTGNIFSLPRLSSFVLATWRSYFPFFTCEVKCGAGGVDVADRQNAHSMTVAVRGIFELFRYVHRGKELHRKVLAFSISHDDKAVRIYSHYPIICGDKITFHRHKITGFDFTSKEGIEKWTAYKFTKNIYDKFMPEHHKLICSAIDAIPADLNFEVSSALFTSNASADNESEMPDSQEMGASAPVSQDPMGPPTKKPRMTANHLLQEQLAHQSVRIDELMKREREEKEQQKEEKEQQKREAERQNARIDELMDLLKRQTSSITSSGNESEGQRLMQQELKREREEKEQQRRQMEDKHDRQEEQNKELMALLKQLSNQQTPVKA